ncbi:MAG TPA: hypothetical protein VGF39_04975, partial [Stellaceae bacterium]
MAERFDMMQAFGGAPTSFQPLVDGPLGIAGGGQMMRQRFRLALDEVGEMPLQRRHHPSVQLLAPGAQQGTVGGILKAATASSRVETLPMFVCSRPSRTRWTISLSWARSDSTTKSTAKPSAGRASAGPDGHQCSSSSNQACGPLLDIAADDIEHQIDAADVFQRVVVEVNELLRAEVERLLTVSRASGADDVG